MNVNVIVESGINVGISLASPNEVNINTMGIQGVTGPSGTSFSGSISNVVYTTGNQIISGIKSFDSSVNDENNESSLNFNTRSLLDGNGTQSLAWNERILKDGFQNYSIQYADRFLRNSAQDYVLDWNNRVLSGFWIGQAANFVSGLSVSGNNVLTGINTGNFITTNQTGAFASSINLLSTGLFLQTEISNLNSWTGNSTGLYYASNNPSGFITGFNSGAFVTTGQTGNFSTNTGQLTGVFYPLNNNPNNYLTGFNSGLYTLNSNTGNFIVNSQTGTFATVVNLGLTGSSLYSNYTGLSGILSNTGNILQTEINSLSGTLTGNYFTSAIITSTYLNATTAASTYATLTTATLHQNEINILSGNLVSTGNNLQTQINTLNSGTGNFITNGQTGTFIINSQSGTFFNSQLNQTSISILSRTTGINCLSTGNTILYTVPSNHIAIITSAIIRCNTVSGITNGPTLNIGVNSGDIFPSTAINALTGINKIFGFNTIGMSNLVTANSVIKIGIDTIASGSLQTISTDLMGYLI